MGPYAGSYGTAITLGDDYVFMAIDEEIHTIPVAFQCLGTWLMLILGTKVNVLFTMNCW